jgi:hypothetical protein
MKKFRVSLIGDEFIEIDEVQKQAIDNFIALPKEKREEFITVKNNKIRLSSIRTIVEIKDNVAEELNKKKWLLENQEWNISCLKMSQLPIEEKVNKELNIRVTACGQVSIPQEVLEKIKIKIQMFFERNPKMPRCPATIWIEDIKKYLGDCIYMARFYEAIGRNDTAIAQWAKFSGIQISY